MNLNEIRKHCGFYYKETYSDGCPNHFCKMCSKPKSVFDYSKELNVTAGGYCHSVEDCPMYKFLKNLNLINKRG
jgi:hypothetical protein